MPLVHPIPPHHFVSDRCWRATQFDIAILRSWAKRTARAGHTFWLHRGRLVSQQAISVWGAAEAWERAEPPSIQIDTTTTPWTVGPA